MYKLIKRKIRANIVQETPKKLKELDTKDISDNHLRELLHITKSIINL